jgi:hypothetical protein
LSPDDNDSGNSLVLTPQAAAASLQKWAVQVSADHALKVPKCVSFIDSRLIHMSYVGVLLAQPKANRRHDRTHL